MAVSESNGLKKCPVCDGEGFLNFELVKHDGTPPLIIGETEECEVCEGTGEIPDDAAA